MRKEARAANLINDASPEAERYRATFRDAGLGIAHSELDGTLTDVNPAFCAMLGQTRDDLVARRLSELHAAHEGHGLTGSRAERRGTRRAHSGFAQSVSIERYRNRKGSTVWVQRTSSVAADFTGKRFLLHFSKTSPRAGRTSRSSASPTCAIGARSNRPWTASFRRITSGASSNSIRIVRVGESRQHDHEFVPGQPPHAVFSAHAFQQPHRDVRNADVAMYSAKTRGRDNFQFYTAEMNERALARLELESQLRNALDQQEIRLHYRPKVAIDSRRICGFEALLRWQPRGSPLVAPGEFIPLLEETGLITPIGEWVVHAACEQLAGWRAAGMRPVPLAINFSARQLRQRGFCDVLARALRERKLPPDSIEVEIHRELTHGQRRRGAEALERPQRRRRDTRDRRFRHWLFEPRLPQALPFDTLKIDRSFVRDISTEAGDRMIARTIIALAESLDLTSVAEGVETEAQLAFLAGSRCQQAQGYLFSRPLPSDSATALLARDKPLLPPARVTARRSRR